MYTLRKITKNFTFNESLGTAYSVVKRDFNKAHFIHHYQSVFDRINVVNFDIETEEKAKDIVAFVVTSVARPIYKDDYIFVMTDSGQTFECINNPHK